MDYLKLKYFLKAAETLNFSKAAREMYITPQSFGKQITLLEQQMGFPLFERSTRQIRLTASGKIVYENLSEIVVELEREYQKMCAMGKKRDKKIRIGVFSALAGANVVSPVVSAILANYPNRDISICMRDMVDLKQDVLNGEIDIGLTVTHATEAQWDNCEAICLISKPARIVVSKYHPWYMQQSVSVDDMRSCDFVKMETPFASKGDAFEHVPCRSAINADNYETMCLMLDQGNCFTVMQPSMDRYCEKKGASFPLPRDPFNFELSLIYSRSNPHTFLPELCGFIQEILEPSDL